MTRQTSLAVAAFLLFGALNFEWISGSLGVPVALLACIISTLSPEAFFLALGASQTVADPAGLPVTVAQALFGAWLLTLPWNGWLPWRHTALRAMSCWLPVACWVCAIGLANRTFDLLGATFCLGLAFGLVASGYAARRRGRERRLLLALLAGSLLSAGGYWGHRAGWPVIAGVYEADSSRQVERIGSGRSDANAVGATLPVATAGLGLFALEAALEARRVRRAAIAVLALGLVVSLTVPATLATASRTGLYAMLAGLVTWLVIALTPDRYGLRPRGSARSIYLAATAATLVSVGAAVALSPDYLAYVEGILRQNELQSAVTGSASVIAGRSDAWLTHLRLIAAHPLTGISQGEIWDFGEYGVTTIGVSGIYGAAHSTVLEFGSLAGIPGAVMFAATLGHLAVGVWSRRSDLRAPLLSLGVTVLVVMSGISVPGWKVFWGVSAVLLTAALQRNDGSSVRVRSGR